MYACRRQGVDLKSQSEQILLVLSEVVEMAEL